MNRAQLAMAYQACAVADLARLVVGLDDPVEASAQASRVLAAAQELFAAATRLTEPGPPGDALQLFAYQHPEEAAEDLTDWIRRHPVDECGT